MPTVLCKYLCKLRTPEKIMDFSLCNRFLLFDLVELQELLLKAWRTEIPFHSGKEPSFVLS